MLARKTEDTYKSHTHWCNNIQDGILEIYEATIPLHSSQGQSLYRPVGLDRRVGLKAIIKKTPIV